MRNNGHDIIHFRPPGLDDVTELYGKFMDADEGLSTLKMLKDGDVDDFSIGPKYRMMTWPLWFKQLIAPLVGLKSPITAGMLTAQANSKESWQLWEMNAQRLALVEKILRSWDQSKVDVVIAPGLPLPAQPLGYPAWQLGAISYTCVYNLLNFPAGTVPVSSAMT